MITTDTYTKAVLTVIAIALCAIALKLFNPQFCSNGSPARSPTVGDLRALREIKDPKQRKEARLRLIKSVPLVNVEGGQINADVSGSSVTIDN